MKLSYLDLDVSIEFNETVTTLVVEDVAFLRKIARELLQQIDGRPGNWVLGSDSKVMDLKRYGYYVGDIFSIPLNHKNLITKLQSQYLEYADLEYELLLEINQKVQDYLYRLEANSSVDVSHIEEVTALDLLKISNLHIEEDDNALNNLLIYCEVVMDLLRPNLLFLVNTRSLLAADEWKLFCKTMVEKKIPVMCFESYLLPELTIDSKLETIYTLDKDLCLI